MATSIRIIVALIELVLFFESTQMKMRKTIGYLAYLEVKMFKVSILVKQKSREKVGCQHPACQKLFLPLASSIKDLLSWHNGVAGVPSGALDFVHVWGNSPETTSFAKCH